MSPASLSATPLYQLALSANNALSMCSEPLRLFSAFGVPVTPS